MSKLRLFSVAILIGTLPLASLTTTLARPAGVAINHDDEGDRKTESRKVGSFSGLTVSNAIEVRLTQGNNTEVIVEANENVMTKIETTVSGNTLHIGLKNGNWWRNSGKIIVRVTSPTINAIEASGASKVESENTINTKSLALDASGASAMKLNLNVGGTISGEISGASSINLKGTANNLSIEGSGASSLKAGELIANTVSVDFSGASSGLVYAKNNLNAEASGASSIRYRGKPTNTSVDASGASSVKKYED